MPLYLLNSVSDAFTGLNHNVVAPLLSGNAKPQDFPLAMTVFGLACGLLIWENYPWKSSNPHYVYSPSYPLELVPETDWTDLGQKDNQLLERHPALTIFSPSCPGEFVNSAEEKKVEDGWLYITQ